MLFAAKEKLFLKQKPYANVYVKGLRQKIYFEKGIL